MYRYIGELPKKGSKRAGRHFTGRSNLQGIRKRMRERIKVLHGLYLYHVDSLHTPVIQLIFRNDVRRYIIYQISISDIKHMN